MIYLLYLIHVVVSLFLILVVLLQQGKGADLSVFGGGATQVAFGARGTASLLHKLTVWGFVAFIVTTISIGFMSSSGSGSSVMSNLPDQGAAQAVDAAVTPEPGEEAIPGEVGPGSDGEEATAGEADGAATDESVESAVEGSVTDSGAGDDTSDQ